MNPRTSSLSLAWAAVAVGSMFSTVHGLAQRSINGQVLGGGAPMINSTVTLFEATGGTPRKVAQTTTNTDGRFHVSAKASSSDTSFYLLATGGVPRGKSANNPHVVLLAVVGSNPPAQVVVDEMTTIASVITHTQFIDGAAVKGSPLALRIAAGNVPNFVDLKTGDYGATILDPLNSSETTTMANFATLANILAACVAQTKSDACSSLYYVATSPSGAYPKDTLEAIEFIVRYPGHQPAKVFGAFNYLYPQPKFKPGRVLRQTPFLPYLTFAPSAWIFPLRFAGGGLSAPGKLMFDSEGNVWLANNFIVGAQNQDASWTGTLSEFAANGKPLSPSPLGFRGGGLAGPGFGLTVDAHDHVWVDSFTGRDITEFDRTGKPLSPPDGWNFGGGLNQMQGIIATPKGDIWAVDTMNAQIVHLPNGDPSKAQFFCQNKTGDPLKNPCKLLAPFAIAIDQQDRIWVTNIGSDSITRFPASNPSNVDSLKAGYSGTGVAVDSLGNVWIANKLGSSQRGHAKLLESLAAFKFNFNGDPDAGARMTHVLVPALAAQTPGYESGGSITVLRPDGTLASFSPVYGKGIFTPWAISVDGNDNIWVSNFASSTAGIVQLCGFRTEHCPPGMKTGDPISPSGGYVGGGLQMQIDIGVGPAGDVWADNNWLDYKAALGQVAEPLSTLGAGQGVVVFYGMAKPVKTPLIGPPRQP